MSEDSRLMGHQRVLSKLVNLIICHFTKHPSIRVPRQMDAVRVEAVFPTYVLHNLPDEGHVVVARRPVAGMLLGAVSARFVAVDPVARRSRELAGRSQRTVSPGLSFSHVHVLRFLHLSLLPT